MSNPFLDHAEKAIPRAVKKKDARQAHALRKKNAEKGKLLGWHKAQWDNMRAELIAIAPNPFIFQRLLDRIDSATPDDGDELIAVATEGQWHPERHRQFLLSSIAGACIRIRLQLGEPPFDDPLWDEPNNIFLDAKLLLQVR